MVKDQLASPVVKWAGGKRQLLSELIPRVPRRFGMYCEPFLGGGAMLLALQPARAEVNDLNADLIAMYETIRDDVEVLIASLARHENTPEYFYTLRDADRHKEAYRNLPKVEKASRLLYLNKTCFNGLFRVNAAGEFNAPFGYYKHPNIVNAPKLAGRRTVLRLAHFHMRGWPCRENMLCTGVCSDVACRVAVKDCRLAITIC